MNIQDLEKVVQYNEALKKLKEAKKNLKDNVSKGKNVEVCICGVNLDVGKILSVPENQRLEEYIDKEIDSLLALLEAAGVTL